MPRKLENLEDLFGFLIGSMVNELEETGFNISFHSGFFYLSHKDISVRFDVTEGGVVEHVYISFQNNPKIQDIDINDDVDDDDISQIILKRFNEVIVPIGDQCLEKL